MSVLWKAVRAVTVETMGVVAVVWVLVAGAGWTFENATAERVHTHTKAPTSQTLQWLNNTASDVVEGMKPQLCQADRERYVQERLDHYSQLYGQEATDYIKRAAGGLSNELGAGRANPHQTTGRELLGSL